MSGDSTAERTQSGGTPVAVDVSVDRRARLTIAMFVAGPIIWSVHFMVVYLVTEAGCTGDGEGLSAFGPPVPTVVTVVATVLAALASLGVALWCYRQWRAVSTAEKDPAPDVDPLGDRQERHGDGLLQFAGFLMGLLGVVTVLFVGLPALVLPAC